MSEMHNDLMSFYAIHEKYNNNVIILEELIIFIT